MFGRCASRALNALRSPRAVFSTARCQHPTIIPSGEAETPLLFQPATRALSSRDSRFRRLTRGVYGAICTSILKRTPRRLHACVALDACLPFTISPGTPPHARRQLFQGNGIFESRQRARFGPQSLPSHIAT